MGNRLGHVGPGLIFLLFGLFLCTKASGAKSTLWVRSSSVFFLMSGAMILAFGEMIYEGHRRWGESHLEHYRLSGVLFLSSLIYILHLFRKLEGSFWGLAIPFGMFSLGLAVTLHHQDTFTHAMAHIILARLFYTFSFFSAIEYLFTVFHYIKLKTPKQESSSKKSLLNPLYLHTAVYDTILPFTSAFFMCMTGFWWIVMGWQMYPTSEFPKWSKYHSETFGEDLNEKSVLITLGLTILCMTVYVFCLNKI